MKRTVGCRLVVSVDSDARLALLVAVARRPGLTVDEALTVEGPGDPAVDEHPDTAGGRLHVLDIGAGTYEVRYDAVVTGRAGPDDVTEAERWTALRPSRYAPSDRLVGFARTEFGGVPRDQRLLAAVSSWVGTRLAYVPGSSGPLDGAVETLLAGQGVCRDYAHLVVGLLRALDVPARLVSVYAPGLAPMDFHAVAEAYVSGGWHVADATLLAPRHTLLRIATGADAADTAFLSSVGAPLRLESIEVRAVVEPDPEPDDLDRLVALG